MEEFEIEIEMWGQAKEQRQWGLDHKRGAGEFAQCGTPRLRVCFDQKKSQFGSNSWELFKMILWMFFKEQARTLQLNEIACILW